MIEAPGGWGVRGTREMINFAPLAALPATTRPPFSLRAIANPWHSYLCILNDTSAHLSCSYASSKIDVPLTILDMSRSPVYSELLCMITPMKSPSQSM